jgi:stress response protein SCP2
MTLNSILLRRTNKFLLPEHKTKTVLPGDVVATFNLNLQSLGYTLSSSALKAVKHLSPDAVKSLFKEITATLAEARGVKNYKPMYPNFPEQVMEATDAELYLNAILHYFTVWVADITGSGADADFIYLPKYTKEKREPLDEKVKLTVLNIAKEDELGVLATRIATSNTSLSATDQEELIALVESGWFDLSTQIPQKENLAIITAILIDKVVKGRKLPLLQLFPDIFAQFKTATDVLRLATALSGGDVSLAADTKFKSFKRSIRRSLLQLLNEAGSIEEDMLRHANRWVALSERLHPGEFHTKFDKAYTAFWKLRNQWRPGVPKIETFNSKIEALVGGNAVETREVNVLKAVALLSKRPGDFARRLDSLLRFNQAKGTRVVEAFAKVAEEVSTPVLLQVMAHFKNRNKNDMRVVFPKGNLAKVQAISGRREILLHELTSAVVKVVEEALTARFAKLPKLGKVYVDPKLADYLVPFSQRSANAALRTLVRGSRIEFPADKNTIRFFIWWKNIAAKDARHESEDSPYYGYSDGRVDLDLSSIMYDENWKQMEYITYYNLRSAHYKACHSGDITTAPKGACEFIDVDIPSILNYGGRYVVMMVNSFTGQNFSQIPEVAAGWMLREKPQSGEIFEPKTVLDKINVTSESKQVMPMVLDLVERKVIWADAAIKANGGRYGRIWGNNVANNSDSISLIGQAFTKIKKPNLYELFTLHAASRGRLVGDPTKADVVFSVEAGTPFELEKIASEFMPNANAKGKAKAAKK